MTARSNRGRKGETLEFHLIYAICFGLCLVAACASRLAPWRLWSSAPDGESHKSIFMEAKLAASNSVPFAFM